MRNRIGLSLCFLVGALLLLCGAAFGMGLSFGDFGSGTTTTTSPTPSLTITYDSAIPTRGAAPGRLAVDDAGRIYAAAPYGGKVLVFSPDGVLLRSLGGFASPFALAVDHAGRLYVGDAADGSVKVFDQAGAFLFSLGHGRKEFGLPGGIAVTPAGTVYVTDSARNVVDLYGSGGAFLSSFGAAGTAPGQFSFPAGIAYDQIFQEVYVVDLNNARVEVFTPAGVFVRAFGSYGSNPGQLARPQGISVANGKVFVADAFESQVDVYDRTGTFITATGRFGSAPGDLDIPMDVVRAGAKLFVANSENRRIEVYSAPENAGLLVAPPYLSFTAYVGATPPSQSVQLSPQVAGSSPAWSATSTAPFVRIGSPNGTAPATVPVGIDTTGLAAGSYTATVLFANQAGTSFPLTVGLTLTQPQLAVSPPALSLLYQRAGTLPTATVSVGSVGGTVNWTAQGGPGWLTLGTVSGVSPATLPVAVNRNATELPDGTYSGSVVVTAPGALGSPATVPVALRVLTAGSIAVTSNDDNASFAITGPETLTGSGRSWRTDEAKPGIYTVAFGYFKGYRRPVTRQISVTTGHLVSVAAPYLPVRPANTVAAAPGPDPGSAAVVRVLGLDGSRLAEFTAFDTRYGARVAMGDVDGDGSDEVVAAPGPGPRNEAQVKVFRPDGRLVAAVAPVAGTTYGAQLAVGDIDGTGTSQIAVSTVSAAPGEAPRQVVILYGMDGNSRLVEKGRIDLAGEGEDGDLRPAAVAFGDVNGDGRLELLVAAGKRLLVYAFDDAYAPTLVATATREELLRHADGGEPRIAAGDLNGDGRDEVLVGYQDGLDSLVEVLNGDLTPFGETIVPFDGGKSAPNLAAMPISDDFRAAILAGAGAYPDNGAILRIFTPDGELMSELKAFTGGRFGANASFGAVKR